jgi:2-(1,2-epoxy-1,2-dihydrophenyl)acetyl-CoA isomerase
MRFETIIYQQEEGIATITLNRPDKLNAWNDQMCQEVEAAIEGVSGDNRIKVLIITGAGKGFSSGADVSVLKDNVQETSIFEGRMGEALRKRVIINHLPVKLRDLNIPVIAAVNGVTAGVGFSIALACDIRIAAEDARFTMVFVKRGLVPDAGATYNLPKIVGISKACELAFTGDFVDAKEAERIGLVSKVVPRDDLMKVTKELANRIAQNPPLTVTQVKYLIHKGAIETSLPFHIQAETCVQALMMQTEDFKEGVQAFLEKRRPLFRGK